MDLYRFSDKAISFFLIKLDKTALSDNNSKIGCQQIYNTTAKPGKH